MHKQLQPQLATAQCICIAVWDVIITITSSPGIWMYAVSCHPWEPRVISCRPQDSEASAWLPDWRGDYADDDAD